MGVARAAVMLGPLLASSVAWGCPVCGGAASQQSQSAYIDMSIILSGLPLVSIGALVVWVALRVRAADRMARSGAGEQPGAAVATGGRRLPRSG